MYPNEIDTFPTRLKGETVEADHMNAVQLGLTAVETVLGFNPTATVTGAMSDGFSVSATLAQPFACDTTARATLTVTPTSVDQINGSGMLLVHGYW